MITSGVATAQLQALTPNHLNKQQKDTRTQQEKADANLFVAIAKKKKDSFGNETDKFDMEAFDKALSSKPAPNINACKVLFSNNKRSNGSAIFAAILVRNRSAVQKLLKLGADVYDILDNDDRSVLCAAIESGDVDIIEDIMVFMRDRKKIMINYDSDSGSALQWALTSDNSKSSLVRYAVWNGEDSEPTLRANVGEWVEGGKPKPRESLSGVYYLNLDLIRLIANTLPDLINEPRRCLPEPIEIARNPSKYIHLFGFNDGFGKRIKPKVGKDNTLVISEFRLDKNTMTEKTKKNDPVNYIPVKELIIDFSFALKALNEIDAKAKADKAAAAAAIAAEAAKAATAAAVSAIESKLAVQDAKIEATNAAVATNTAAVKADLAALKKDTAPVVEKDKFNKDRTDRVKAVSEEDSDPSSTSFFTTIQGLAPHLTAYETITAEFFERKNKNPLDYASSAIKGLDGIPLPIVNKFGTLASALLKHFADNRETSKGQVIVDLMRNTDTKKCSKDLALELTEWLVNYFRHLNPAESKALAEKVKEIIWTVLFEEARTLNANEPMAKQLARALITSPAFNEHLKTIRTKDVWTTKWEQLRATPHLLTLSDKIQTNLEDFWNIFSSGFAKAANFKTKGFLDLGTVIDRLEKTLGIKSSVGTLYSPYVQDWAKGVKVKMLNPLSLRNLALRLTEMVQDHASKQKMDLSLKPSTDLKSMADHVAKQAIKSIFASLCKVSASPAVASVTTSFQMTSLDDDTQAIVNDLNDLKSKENEGLMKCLNDLKSIGNAATVVPPLKGLPSGPRAEPCKQPSPNQKVDSNKTGSDLRVDPKMPLPPHVKAHLNVTAATTSTAFDPNGIDDSKAQHDIMSFTSTRFRSATPGHALHDPNAGGSGMSKSPSPTPVLNSPAAKVATGKSTDGNTGSITKINGGMNKQDSTKPLDTGKKPFLPSTIVTAGIKTAALHS